MSASEYGARKNFLIPLIMDTLLLSVLVIISIFKGFSPAETVILVIIFIPILYLCIESLNRKIFVEATGIRIKKLFREKSLQWEDITNLDAMVIQRKVYLLLTTTKGFHILTNTYGNFISLVNDIIDHVDERKVEPKVLEISQKSLVRTADILTAWIAFAILVIVIILKLAYGG